MTGVILNTEEEYNTLQLSLHNYVYGAVDSYNATKWSSPIIGEDGTYLMLMDDPRLKNFDFTGYSISYIAPNNENYFGDGLS